jgi:hypothetical protein
LLDIKVQAADFDNAISMANESHHDISTQFNSLSLVKRQDKQSPAVIIKEFPLLKV